MCVNPYLSVWFMWFHQLHSLSPPDQDDLGVSQPGHIQRLAPQERHHTCGATAQVLPNTDECLVTLF